MALDPKSEEGAGDDQEVGDHGVDEEGTEASAQDDL
jgi:hypothetical protein